MSRQSRNLKPGGAPMPGRIASLTGALLAATLFAPCALADGKRDCTAEPPAKWKLMMDAEATAKAAGHDVRGSKVSGTCYEVYAMRKDGRKIELFYHPIELKLMQTVIK